MKWSGRVTGVTGHAAANDAMPRRGLACFAQADDLMPRRGLACFAHADDPAPHQARTPPHRIVCLAKKRPPLPAHHFVCSPLVAADVQCWECWGVLGSPPCWLTDQAAGSASPDPPPQ